MTAEIKMANRKGFHSPLRSETDELVFCHANFLPKKQIISGKRSSFSLILVLTAPYKNQISSDRKFELF